MKGIEYLSEDQRQTASRLSREIYSAYEKFYNQCPDSKMTEMDIAVKVKQAAWRGNKIDLSVKVSEFFSLLLEADNLYSRKHHNIPLAT